MVPSVDPPSTTSTSLSRQVWRAMERSVPGNSAAAFSVMVPLIVADVAFGTGHFNLAQGVLGTATGIGASLSTVLAGYISDKLGSPFAFLTLACIAALGLALIALVMPETRRSTY